jgi:hypothetical protein
MWEALMPTTLPVGLPILAAGAHRSETDGACLLEFVSVLAGEPFSVHPSCVHPILAAIARGVDANVSEPARPALAVIVPDLIGTRGAAARADPILCGLVAAAALRVDPTHHSARRELCRARRRARACRPLLHGWIGLTRRRYQRFAVRRVAQLVATPIGAGGDDGLVTLLTEAAAVCQRHGVAR